jgi:hypothetical protein
LRRRLGHDAMTAPYDSAVASLNTLAADVYRAILDAKAATLGRSRRGAEQLHPRQRGLLRRGAALARPPLWSGNLKSCLAPVGCRATGRCRSRTNPLDRYTACKPSRRDQRGCTAGPT